MKNILGVTLIVICVIVSGCVQSNDTGSALSGPYLGQELPGDDPILFAPGIVSTGMYERDLTMTPNGKEIYFSLIVGSYATILYCKEVDGTWTEPEVANFAKNPDYFYFEPHVTPDGQQLMFLGTIPPPGEEPKPGWGHQHIWVVDRISEGLWSEPYLFGEPITTADNDYFPSVTEDGTLYFTRSLKSNPRGAMIYRSRKVNGRYEEPEKVSENINKKGGVYNAFIAPDESYLISCSGNQESLQSPGVADYYIFYRNEKDEWSEGINLGSKINATSDGASAPYVSPDGEYFFFSSSRFAGGMADSTLQFSAKIIDELYNSPGNGSSDIYWMSADFIEKIRPSGF